MRGQVIMLIFPPVNGAIRQMSPRDSSHASLFVLLPNVVPDA